MHPGLRGIRDALLDAVQVRLYHCRLAREVLVEGPFGHRRFGCEAFNASGVDAFSVEQLGGSIQDALACATAALAGRRLHYAFTHSPSIPNGLHRASSRVGCPDERKYTNRFTGSGHETTNRRGIG